MNLGLVLLISIILSISPVSELRGGIPYAILNGINPLTAFLVCVIFNVAVIPLVFLFLDYINGFLMKFNAWRDLFTKYLNRKVAVIKNKYQTLSLFVLFVFVAVPLHGTGAYTGCLLAWFFKLDRKKSFAAIGFGVIAAGVITLILTLLGISLFDWLFKLYLAA